MWRMATRLDNAALYSTTHLHEWSSLPICWRTAFTLEDHKSTKVKSSMSFCNLLINLQLQKLPVNCWWNWLLVSFSSTFCSSLFLNKSVLRSFSQGIISLCNLLSKKQLKKWWWNRPQTQKSIRKIPKEKYIFQSNEQHTVIPSYRRCFISYCNFPIRRRKEIENDKENVRGRKVERKKK